MNMKEVVIAIREDRALQEAVKALDSMPANGDPEALHGEAENIIDCYLREIGAGELADAFDNACGRVGFWYA